MTSSDDERFSNWKIQRLRTSLENILIATNNFAEENLLNRGEKADVYKGVLQRWLDVEVEEDVVIRRYRRDHEFNFYEELHKIYVFQYGNFVSFYGFCDEEGERIIVLEYAENGSLSRYLSDSTMTWSQKLFVCFGAASGLIAWDKDTKIKDMSYGGTGIRPAMKSFKILLDKDWLPSILICTNALYDVKDYSSGLYCLGVIMLELLYGRKVTIDRYEEAEQVDDMIPPDLRTQIEPRSLSIFEEIAYKCLKEEPDLESHIETRLWEAYDNQWRNEHSSSTQLLLNMKIPLSGILTATNGFSEEHRITPYLNDEFYKGKLGPLDGETRVFIKRCNKETESKDFFSYIEMLSVCDLSNIPVSLLGFCVEDSEMILVFERESRDLPKCLDALFSLEVMYLNASVYRLPDIPPEDIATTDFDEEKVLKLGGMPDIHEGLLFRWRNQDVMEAVVIWKYLDPRLTYDSFPLFWHRNAVLVYGYFYKGGETMIVMEYPVNGSLDDYLSDPLALTWCQRLSICYGAACVFKCWEDKVNILLRYHNLNYPIIESMKIFLDKDWEAKVLICTKKHPWNSNENYNFSEYGLGVIMLEMLYCRKVTTEDVNQYIDSYERGENVEDMIDPHLREQMPQTDPRSLSILLETACKCLKKEGDLHRHQIQQRLKDAYEDQLEYIDTMF